jgi:predicted metalloprotease
LIVRWPYVRLRWWVLVLAALACAGCSAPVAGTGSPAVIRPADLCPSAGTDAAAITTCVVGDLERSWTRRLSSALRLKVVVDPAPAEVHRSCRAFLAFGTAFYCPSDNAVFVTAAAVARDRAEFGDRLPYGLAAVLAHEAGHRAQFIVDQPELETDGDTASRQVEQQADCLAGSWVRDAARRGLVDPTAFRTVYAREMQIVSELEPPPGAGLDDYDEVATHGTPAQRVAAYDRGARSDDPVAACTLKRP